MSSYLSWAALAVFFAASPAAVAAQPSGGTGPFKEACQEIGLKPGETQFDDCVKVLERSTVKLMNAKMGNRAPTACAKAGLKAGTDAFDNCVGDLRQSLNDDTINNG